VVGPPLRDVRLDKGIIIGAIIRDGQVVMQRGDTAIKPKDRLVVFAEAQAIKKVEKLFAVRVEYF